MELNFWISAAAAACTGVLSGLGVGGGSLMMLWLTAGAGLDPAEAAVLNYLYFIPCAGLATLLRRKRGNLQKSLLIPAIAAGAMGAVAGNLIRARLSAEVLHRILGMFFLWAGARELFYRPRELR